VLSEDVLARRADQAVQNMPRILERVFEVMGRKPASIEDASCCGIAIATVTGEGGLRAQGHRRGGKHVIIKGRLGGSGAAPPIKDGFVEISGGVSCGSAALGSRSAAEPIAISGSRS
jgi:hypothetical protein